VTIINFTLAIYQLLSWIKKLALKIGFIVANISTITI